MALTVVACGDERGDAPAMAAAGRGPLAISGKALVETATGTAVANELVVELDGRLGDRAAMALVGDAGGELVYRGARSGRAVVRFPDAAAAQRGAALLRAGGAVGEILPHHVMEAAGHGGGEAGGTGIGTSPSAPIAALQWNLYVMGLNPMSPQPRGAAPGITVAVLDTGVAYETYSDESGVYRQAPALAGVSFAPGWDFVNDDAHPNDDQRHGTHVTSVIAARAGIGSVSPGVTILPVKVLDADNRGSELALAEGIRFAVDEGADVINLSLSFPPTYFPTRLLQEAVDHATRHGVTIVAAAGNHGEDLVAYPAAFRDVIAVGATSLPPWLRLWGKGAVWHVAALFLERAPYSNRSHKLDVVAPGGTTGGDVNGDGSPEAVLGQTFAPGAPTDFGWYFFAGTSQAAAQVSGVVAAVLARNAGLTPGQVRTILGDSALPMGTRFLSVDTGRGAVRADLAMALAHGGRPARPRHLANVVVTLHERDGGALVARARAEIVGEDGKPAPYAWVYGTWTGAAFGAVTVQANAQGVAEVVSAPLEGQPVVAFQVDGVAKPNGLAYTLDRPRGFMRIDAASLARLMAFAGTIDTTDELAPGAEAGLASPGVGGTGIGTSPSYVPTDPRETPLSVAFAPGVFGDRYRATVMLPSFGWALATVPMAVAIDESWFLATFPGAAARRVVSRGPGVGPAPLVFDDASFPSGPPPVVIDDSVPTLPLMVVTFASGTGIGTSPSAPGAIFVDPLALGVDAGLRAGVRDLVDAWLASGAGIGTSPSYVPGGPLDPPTWDLVSGVASGYAGFAASPAASPAAAYGSALGAAALPLAPVSPASDGPGVGWSEL